MRLMCCVGSSRGSSLKFPQRRDRRAKPAQRHNGPRQRQRPVHEPRQIQRGLRTRVLDDSRDGFAETTGLVEPLDRRTGTKQPDVRESRQVTRVKEELQEALNRLVVGKVEAKIEFVQRKRNQESWDQNLRQGAVGQTSSVPGAPGNVDNEATEDKKKKKEQTKKKEKRNEDEQERWQPDPPPQTYAAPGQGQGTWYTDDYKGKGKDGKGKGSKDRGGKGSKDENTTRLTKRWQRWQGQREERQGQQHATDPS